MKIFCLIVLVFPLLCHGTDAVTAMHRRVSKLPDMSSEVGLKLNSMPGVDENIISEYVFQKKIKTPFLVRSGSLIYIANPNEIEGYLWWRKVRVLPVNQHDFKSFVDNPSKNLEMIKVFSSILDTPF